MYLVLHSSLDHFPSTSKHYLFLDTLPPNLNWPSKSNRFSILWYPINLFIQRRSTTVNNQIAAAIKRGQATGKFNLPKGVSGKVKLAKPASGKEVSLIFLFFVTLSN